MIAVQYRSCYFYTLLLNSNKMKKRLILFSCILISMAGLSQEEPPKVPPIKNNVIIKNLPLPPNKNIPTKPVGNIPVVIWDSRAVSAALQKHSWNLTRWWITNTAGHSDGDPGFMFEQSSVSCSYWISDAFNRFTSGTYSITGKNVQVVLTKNDIMKLTCNLVYDTNNDKLTGTYKLEIFSITNPPANYKPGVTTGEMKLDKN